MNGWVKLYKKFVDWEWADEPNMVSLFVHLLLRACSRDTKWKGIDLKRGQVVFGRAKWSERTGISEQGLRTCLKKLESTGEITINPTNKYTIITIINYDEYQAVKGGSQPANQPAINQQINQQPTSNQPHRKKGRSKEVKKKEEEPVCKPGGIGSTCHDPLF